MPTKVKGTTGVDKVEASALITDPVFSGTGSVTIPVGTTAQRPSSPTNGEIRFNTTTGEPEWYDSSSSQWVNFQNGKPYSAEYVIVAGGGGGAGNRGGGGGAGGMITGTSYITPSTSYTIT